MRISDWSSDVCSSDLAFLKESAMPPSVFGRAALRDPCFVSDLRGGRQPGREIIGRAEHFMNKWRADRRVGDVAPLGDRRTRAFWRRDAGSEIGRAHV